MKRGILCVLKEPTDLPDLDRLQEEWETAFAQNCAQALEMMTLRPVEQRARLLREDACVEQQIDDSGDRLGGVLRGGRCP
jgi:hypothetical protein